MKLAESMKNITENIIACHNVRVKALGDLVDQVNASMADVNRQMKEVTANRKKVSAEQAAELGRFASALSGDVGKKLKTFRHNLEIMAKDRALTGKELRAGLEKDAKELKNAVKKTMAGYRGSHQEMSAAMRKDLEAFVKGVVGGVGDLTAATQGMMKHYRDDIHRAGEAWRHMAHTLAKARCESTASGEGAEGAEGAIRKIKRRRKKRK